MRIFFFFFGGNKSRGQQVLMEFVDWIKKNGLTLPILPETDQVPFSESSVSDVL